MRSVVHFIHWYILSGQTIKTAIICSIVNCESSIWDVIDASLINTSHMHFMMATYIVFMVPTSSSITNENSHYLEKNVLLHVCDPSVSNWKMKRDFSVSVTMPVLSKSSFQRCISNSIRMLSATNANILNMLETNRYTAQNIQKQKSMYERLEKGIWNIRIRT